jgi:hypothetical protein
MYNFIKYSLLTVITVALAIAACTLQAYACPGSNKTGNVTQAQLQGQSQAATATSNSPATATASTAPIANNSAAESLASGGSGGTATTGAVASQSALSTTSNSTYVEAARAVQPATVVITGCQVSGQAGGSTTRAAGMLGIGFTPASCYDYIQAQAYAAIGAFQAACEILNHTKAALRAIKNGATLPACVAPSVAVAAPQPQGYTREQVDAIVKKISQK